VGVTKRLPSFFGCSWPAPFARGYPTPIRTSSPTRFEVVRFLCQGDVLLPSTSRERAPCSKIHIGPSRMQNFFHKSILFFECFFAPTRRRGLESKGPSSSRKGSSNVRHDFDALVHWVVLRALSRGAPTDAPVFSVSQSAGVVRDRLTLRACSPLEVKGNV